MTHNVDGTRKGGSAEALGDKCTGKPHGLTKCAANMAAAIDSMPATLNVANFDLVGLQEASRWHLLQTASSTALDKLAAVGGQALHSEMASFYDAQKFDLLHQTPADARFSDSSKDRPFKILVLNRKNTSDGVIFINCHCPHGAAVNSQHPQKLTYADFRAVAFDLGTALEALQLSAAEKAYRIVVVGDFNDTGWDTVTSSLVPHQWTPLESAGISTTVSIDPTPFVNPPQDVRLRLRTCCIDDGDWADSSGNLKEGWRGGDYIFDSAQPAPAQIPALDKKYYSLCSDHLPVVALM